VRALKDLAKQASGRESIPGRSADPGAPSPGELAGV
jgi:hypothetical protein